jgi:uncharacterized protein YkwD
MTATPAWAESQSIERQIEQLVAEAARRSGPKGREAPQPDRRLSAAAADLARVLLDDGAPPGSAVLADALALHGLVEPSPHLMVAAYAPGSERALLDELRRSLGAAVSEGRWRRFGLAVVPLSETRRRVVLLLLESFIELEPPPREAPLSDLPVPIQGRVLPPFTGPQVLVTDPAGLVARVPAQVRDQRFAAEIRCRARGRHQIEVTAEGRHGTTVLANFPLYCGTPAPRDLLTGAAGPEPPFRDAAEAEQQLLRYLNQDRARFGLPPLTWDPRLAEVARGHSRDMRAHDFVGHVSPRSGSPVDRVRRAGIAHTMVLENLARAYSPREVQRGLMDSPGHRANILNKEVTHVGIGVEIAATPGGVRELWVAQLLSRPPAPFDARKAPAQALTRLAELREKQQLKPLVEDPRLMEVAGKAALALSQGRLSEERVGEPAQQALPALAGRFRLLRTVLALTSDVTRLQASPALLDPAATHIGIGVQPAPQKGGGGTGLYVVFVLGQ